jgi:hypothetical protein
MKYPSGNNEIYYKTDRKIMFSDGIYLKIKMRIRDRVITKTQAIGRNCKKIIHRLNR